MSRTAALQLQDFAAPLINDRFPRGIAAVAGCVPRPKDGLCKLRYLPIAAACANLRECRLSCTSGGTLGELQHALHLGSQPSLEGGHPWQIFDWLQSELEVGPVVLH